MKGKVHDWEPVKLKFLASPKRAQGYIEACLEEGLPLHYALGEVIKAQGVAKVSRRAHIAVPNVIRAVKKRSNPTYETLQKLLNGVGLALSVRALPVGHIRKDGGA